MDLPANYTKQKSTVLYLFLLISIFQLAPYFLLQENVRIHIADIMDVYIPQYKIVGTPAFSFCEPDKPVEQIINGLNRDLLVSDLSIITILFLLLNPFWAYTINLLLIKIIAFVGMFLLLKNNFKTFNCIPIFIITFIFSCIPFFPFFGIGIAGQPLLLYALINIHKKSATVSDIIILLLFPFYSSLVFTTIFILFFIALYCLYAWIKNKTFPIRLVSAAVVLFFVGLIADYRLIHASLDPSFIPHRIEFNLAVFSKDIGMSGLLRQAFNVLFTGVYHHVETFYSFFVICLLLLSLNKAPSPNRFLIRTITVSLLFISLLYGFTHSRFYAPISQSISFLKTFQIDRFYTMLPFFYFLLAIFSVERIFTGITPLKKRIVIVITGLACMAVFFNSFSILSFFRFTDRSGNKLPTYAEYYDTPVMNSIEQAIAQPFEQYRICSIGIDPAVLQYHGFYTPDAYLNIYPLEYKKKFREVIRKELDKSVELKTYFDNWGNRCYLFSSEIGKEINKQNDKLSTIHPDINVQALKKLSDSNIYLLSSKKIDNADTLGLVFIKEFHSDYNFRKEVLLYKVR